MAVLQSSTLSPQAPVRVVKIKAEWQKRREKRRYKSKVRNGEEGGRREAPPPHLGEQ